MTEHNTSPIYIAASRSGIDAASIERVLIGNDLSKLTEEQRLAYYHRVCESLGLAPTLAPRFDGATFDPALDQARLGAQYLRVWAVISDGRWRTLGEIAAACGDPEASISARLRDFRKPKFGAHVIERRRRGDGERGHFEYRLVRG